MSRWPPEELFHIRDEAAYLVRHCRDLDRDAFQTDETLQRAFVRALEVIGQATKRLPPDFREKHPQVNWRAISGMRDRLIHAYFGVDYEIVWDAARNKVPTLLKQIEAIIVREGLG